jgi:hypothetical protein
MATSGQGLWTPFGEGDSVRDYRHAARIFGSNDYARAPKSKYLFYVNFVLNPAASAINMSAPIDPLGPNELSYLVKSIEMPKFEIDVQDLNQYNRKVIVQRGIKYSPITIKFHDDNFGNIRDFWTSYYTFYYADGRYQDNVHWTSDTYLDRKSSRWGFDTGVSGNNGANYNYIDSIEIFSMHHGIAQKITLENPIISSFSHDTHDYSEGQGMLETTMQVHYSSVRYGDDDGKPNVLVSDIPGFGASNPDAYDTLPSSLTNGSGYQVDPQSGDLYDPANGLSSMTSMPTSNPYYAAQNYAYNTYSSTAPSFITNAQLSAIAQNAAYRPANSGFSFPIATIQPPGEQIYGAVPVGGSIGYSDGLYIPTPYDLNTTYEKNSWQNTLFQKGYNPAQISAAAKYINLSNNMTNSGQPVNYQKIAETYIRNSTGQGLAASGTPKFGQAAKNPTNINFSNPASSTQPIYNSQNWQQQLVGKGYSNSDISKAQNFLSSIKVAPGANLPNIAENYIKNSKNRSTSNGKSSTVLAKKASNISSALRGPNFNPADNTGIVYAGGNPNFDETTGKYTNL